jgi:hypothetical protein
MNVSSVDKVLDQGYEFKSQLYSLGDTRTHSFAC